MHELPGIDDNDDAIQWADVDRLVLELEHNVDSVEIEELPAFRSFALADEFCRKTMLPADEGLDWVIKDFIRGEGLPNLSLIERFVARARIQNARWFCHAMQTPVEVKGVPVWQAAPVGKLATVSDWLLVEAWRKGWSIDWRQSLPKRLVRNQQD